MNSEPVKDKQLGNREKLLRGAMDCLREKGYARTTARDLVAASGANLASIGYHYGSKEALLNEAIAVGFREFVAEVERATFAAESDTSVGRLQRSLSAMVDRFAEIEPLVASFVEAFPQAVRSPELRERLAESYEEDRTAGADMIVRSVEADGMSLDHEHAETLASVLTALCDGLMLQWLLDPERTPSSADIMEALAAAAPVVASLLSR
jgi:AcrR family transcriptional regulator